MGYKWRYQPKHRLKRNKEKGTTEYFLKHLAVMKKEDQWGLKGLLTRTIRKRDLERLERGEPSKLRLRWSSRRYEVNWDIRSEIWHNLLRKGKLYWVPFYAAYMTPEMFGPSYQQERIHELVELYFKRYGIYP